MSDAATLFNKYKTAPKGGVFSMEGSGSSWDIQIYDWSEGQSDQKLITLRNGLTKTNRCAGRFFKVGTEFQFTIVSMKGTFPPSAQTALRQQLKNATITLQKSSEAQADEDRLQKMLAGGGDKSDAQQLGMNEDELEGLDLMFGDEAKSEEDAEGAEADGLDDLGDLADLDGLAGPGLAPAPVHVGLAFYNGAQSAEEMTANAQAALRSAEREPSGSRRSGSPASTRAWCLPK